MGDPEQYLPNCSIEDVVTEIAAIEFPPADVISALSVGASYHKVFKLQFSQSKYTKILESMCRTSALPQSTHKPPDANEALDMEGSPLILRVSGPHVPVLKTANEVGIVSYLAKHTSIPVPRILHYNASRQNAMNNEYMIMDHLPGVNGSDIYSCLSKNQLSHILDQLVTICLELYSLDFHHIGGLQPDSKSNLSPIEQLRDGRLVSGPPVLETMWQAPDIDEHFNHNLTNKTTEPPEIPRQSFESLNAIESDGYRSYSAWLAAQMRVYLHAIKIHPSLHWLYDQDQNLTGLKIFKAKLETDTALQTKLNSVPLKLAHRDLHFGNILLSPEHTSLTSTDIASETWYKISGILDWEFAAIIPFPLWRHSFLWDGIRAAPPSFAGSQAQFHAESRKTRNELFEEWSRKASQSEIGRKMLKDAKWQNQEQEYAWDVVNYLRCIVEVCPRGKQLDDARGWWREVVRALKYFEIEVEK